MQTSRSFPLRTLTGLVAGFALFAIAFAQEAQRMDTHVPGHVRGHAADHAAGHAAGSTANVVTAGDLELLLEPLVDVAGAMKIAVTVTRAATPADEHGTLFAVTPDGSLRFARLEHGLLLLDLPDVREGTYALFGDVGGQRVDTSIEVYRQTTELGSDMILVLAPAACRHHPSEAFVYAFEHGESIHRLFTVTTTDPHGHAAAEGTNLVHTHFREAFNAPGFHPMANQAPVAFAAGGTWTLDVRIHGGMPDHAAFAILVPHH